MKMYPITLQVTILFLYEIEKYDIPKYFLKTSNWWPLRIHFIPYEHADVNGNTFCVHEIGHSLTFNLTGDPEKVPDSFVEFNERFNPSWQKELVEIFVDLFSMVVMMDTEYADKKSIIKRGFSETAKNQATRFFVCDQDVEK